MARGPRKKPIHLSANLDHITLLLGCIVIIMWQPSNTHNSELVGGAESYPKQWVLPSVCLTVTVLPD